MPSFLFPFLSFLVSGFSFGFGAVRLFRKGKPLYFQLLVCAAGCFALKQLSETVTLLCGGSTDTYTVGMFGVFGCNFFLLSANYGTLDKIVDDGSSPNRRAKLVSLAAPAAMLMLSILVFFAWKTKETLCAVMWLLMLLPALPASYFNMKHLLLPMDDFGFLRATKPCNIAALCFYGMTSACILCSASGSVLLSGILSVCMALSALGLAVAAEKGAGQWGI